MKRKLFAVTIIMSMVLSLSACTKEEETIDITNNTEPVVETEAETVVTESISETEVESETVEETEVESETVEETEETTETETVTESETEPTESVSKTANDSTPKTYADGFDPKFYASNNPDVVNAYGNNADALYDHYLNHGKAEGRLPNADAVPAPSTSATQQATSGQYNTSDGQPPYLILEFGYLGDGTIAPAGGPTNLTSLTFNEVPLLLNSIQSALPTGTAWGMEKTYNWLGDRNGDNIPATQQACGAFAFYLQDAVFANTPATQDIEGELTFKLYDVVYLFDLYGGHGGFITGINNTNRTITVAEGGLNGKIRWGGVYSFDDIVGVVTRY